MSDIDEILSAVGSQVTGIVSAGAGHICFELDGGRRLITIEGEFELYITERSIQ